MKQGLLIYDEGPVTYNVGDYVQSLAAKQFLTNVDEYINREELGSYQGEDIKMILNGWFTHNHSNWIPSNKINPLFVSFHVNSSAAPYMLDEIGVNYLKKNEPIGCRDKHTASVLKDKGIDAYFTGCLTLTLDNYKKSDTERGEDIYIVDPFYSYPDKDKIFSTAKTTIKGILSGDAFNTGKAKKYLKKILSEEVLDSAHYITQVLPSKTHTEEQKFANAEECLKKYAKAKLVITSRIHCALPCLAMGTPVIFVNAFNTFVDTCRFDGIAELFNRIDVADDGTITNNFGLQGKVTKDTTVINLGLHHNLADPLKEKCKNFIK